MSLLLYAFLQQAAGAPQLHAPAGHAQTPPDLHPQSDTAVSLLRQSQQLAAHTHLPLTILHEAPHLQLVQHADLAAQHRLAAK